MALANNVILATALALATRFRSAETRHREAFEFGL
jgi:hypothetical protein